MRAFEFLAEKLGPHAGKEVELLITGAKPAALLTYRQLPELLPYLKSGQLVAIQEYNHPKLWIVGQKNERNRVFRIYFLLKKKEEEVEEFGMHALSQKPNTNYHVKLGRLLGYSEEDINHHQNYMELRRQADEDKRRAISIRK